jgi:hypothetical protein
MPPLPASLDPYGYCDAGCWFVSLDNGGIYVYDADLYVQRKITVNPTGCGYSGPGDFEGIAYVDRFDGFIYLLDEGQSGSSQPRIVEASVLSVLDAVGGWTCSRVWDLNGTVPWENSQNDGPEAFEFLPYPADPEGGYFVIGHQDPLVDAGNPDDDSEAYVLELSLSSGTSYQECTGTSCNGREFNSPWDLSWGVGSTRGFHYDRGLDTLYMISTNLTNYFASIVHEGATAGSELTNYDLSGLSPAYGTNEGFAWNGGLLVWTSDGNNTFDYIYGLDCVVSSCDDGISCTDDTCTPGEYCSNVDNCTGGGTCNLATGSCEGGPDPDPGLTGAGFYASGVSHP